MVLKTAEERRAKWRAKYYRNLEKERARGRTRYNRDRAKAKASNEATRDLSAPIARERAWLNSEAQKRRTAQATRKGRTCEVCGRTYDATHTMQRTCSRECGLTLRGFEPKPQRPLRTFSCRRCGELAKTRQPHVVNCAECAGSRPLRTAPPFDCVVCGTHVVPGEGGIHVQKRAYCSAKCTRRSHHIRDRDSGRASEAKSRRRARKKNAYVAPVNRVAIFERDNFRCQLCGKKLRMDVSVPHPLAPTLDHIVPFVVGGTEEPANVQAAHYRCNVRKGAGVFGAGEQLRVA